MGGSALFTLTRPVTTYKVRGMVLKRRSPKTIRHHVHDFLWPRMGWIRTIKYYWKRIIRLRDDPSKISRGIAVGVGVCFIPLPGTHFIQAAVGGYLLRGNILAALIATWAGNPWTFPFMWWAAYAVGTYMFGVLGLPILEMPVDYSWHDLWVAARAHPFELVLPWVMGGYMLMLVTGLMVFYGVRPIVAAAQHRRIEAKVKRRHARHGHGHPGHGR